MSRTITIQGPDLYDLQYDALFNSARYAVIEGGTKSGKTVGALVWQISRVFEDQGTHWWVAPVSSQARMAYERAQELLPQEIYEAHDTHRELSFLNGSRWAFKSGDKADSLYGSEVESAVIDEASRVKEESWHAIRSTTTATGGPIRIIGNVKGKNNWFYKLARRAEERDEGRYEYTKITAFDAVDAGVLDIEEIEDARDSLPDHVFDELYLCKASDDGSNPFKSEAIEAAIRPLSSGTPTVWGWDLAKSTDWTVGIALDKEGHVCRYERFQKDWESTIDEIIQHTGDTPAKIDSTGVGDPILEAVEKHCRHASGFKFTSSSKQRLMEGLAVAIQSGTIGYPDNRIKYELDNFEMSYSRGGVRYEAQEGLHDDCVCALALAVKIYTPAWRMDNRATPSAGGTRQKFKF